MLQLRVFSPRTEIIMLQHVETEMSRRGYARKRRGMVVDLLLGPLRVEDTPV